jgi:ribosome-associated protein YbcJ (S4-like RNA binding protein)
MIQDGMVDVNGETETRRGKKLRDGDVVQVAGAEQGPMKVSFTDEGEEEQ